MKITINGTTVEHNSDTTYTVTYQWGAETYSKNFENLERVRDFIWNVTDRETGDAMLEAIQNAVHTGGTETQVETLQQELATEKAKVADLEARLKRSLEMDALMENQELKTLRKEIGYDLHDVHLAFTANPSADEDMFEDYKFFLKRIFKVLERHGIDLSHSR